jgi:hypothetical protein
MFLHDAHLSVTLNEKNHEVGGWLAHAGNLENPGATIKAWHR